MFPSFWQRKVIECQVTALLLQMMNDSLMSNSKCLLKGHWSTVGPCMMNTASRWGRIKSKVARVSAVFPAMRGH